MNQMWALIDSTKYINQHNLNYHSVVSNIESAHMNINLSFLSTLTQRDKLIKTNPRLVEVVTVSVVIRKIRPKQSHWGEKFILWIKKYKLILELNIWGKTKRDYIWAIMISYELRRPMYSNIGYDNDTDHNQVIWNYQYDPVQQSMISWVDVTFWFSHYKTSTVKVKDEFQYVIYEFINDNEAVINLKRTYHLVLTRMKLTLV